MQTNCDHLLACRMEEEWRIIKNYPDYEINIRGIVRRKTPKMGTKIGKLIKPYKCFGYYKYHFWVDNKMYRRFSHQLVYETFLGPIMPGYIIHHKDGNKLNNHASNLLSMPCGDHARHINAKLSLEDITFIRKLFHRGYSRKELSYLFNMSYSNIVNIINGRTWIYSLWDEF